MPQRRLVVVAAAGLVLLTGCATRGGTTAAEQPSAEDITATLPAEQRAPILEAEDQLREAQRQADRAEEAVKLAQQRVQTARADLDAKGSAISQAEARVDLVREQTRAQLQGAPVSGQAPSEVQEARKQLDEAEHAVEVARWERDRAQALVSLREAELAYAEAFRDAAREQVDVRARQVDVARAQAASAAAPGAVPGVVDPRVAEAEAQLRQAQAEFANAHAEATQRLSDVQLRRQTMARFESGPPRPLSGAAQAGQSGAETLASQPTRVEAQPLPWPSAWQPGQGSEGGSQTPPAK